MPVWGSDGPRLTEYERLEARWERQRSLAVILAQLVVIAALVAALVWL